MEIAKIAGVGIIVGLLAVSLKKFNPEISMQISIAGGVIVFIIAIGYLAGAVSYISDIAARYSLAFSGANIILKIIGIAYICEFAVSVLADAGEKAVASKVELAGKLIILSLTIPLFSSFFGIIEELLK